MKAVGDSLVLSASDLSIFLGCRHRTALDLAVARGELARPAWVDSFADSLRARGEEHERRYIESLREDGLAIVDLTDQDDADRQTVGAMREGVDAIVQACLRTGRWLGYADILQRIDTPSDLGPWSYEVIDTKLARETRGTTILQLSAYSDLVAHIQGRPPEHFHVVTPGADAPIRHTYRVDDYTAYYRMVKAQLEAAVELGAEALQTGHYPEPVEACEMCRWWARCNERRRKDDHLSFIAGIGRIQRTELESRQIATLAAAAAMAVPLAFKPSRGSTGTYERIREQARVQHAQRTAKTPVHELVLPIAEGVGLARLPEPSIGDLFLDLEGARFAREGGREYLFGIGATGALGATGPIGAVRCTGATGATGAVPCTGAEVHRARAEFGYRAYWAYDDGQERAAFEAVIDLILQRWDAHPEMHVYHFGHYEPTTFKRLMGRHATRAEALDRLLRAERFVDLHTIVRQSLRAGVESYSIKQLEQFYRFTRDVPLGDASAQLMAIDLALESGTPDLISADVREAVQGYNRDDCRSTLALREWLETLRADLISSGTGVPRPTPKEDEPPPNVKELQQRAEAVRKRLLEAIPPEASDPTHAEHSRWLLAYLVDWHRREDKAQYWEYYRLKDLPEDQLLDEPMAIAGLEYVERVDVITNKKTGNPTGSVVDRYRYPAQEMEIGRKATLKLQDGGTFGEVHARDLLGRTVDVRKGPSKANVHPECVFSSNVVPSDAVQEAVIRFAESIASGDERFAGRCGDDLLFRRAPRLRHASLVPNADEPISDLAVRIVGDLDRTTLAVQGPPGAGKTYTGAKMIRALVRAGKRVGVTAVSHKVIRNLLDEVQAQAVAAGETVALAHLVKEAGPELSPVREIVGPEAAVEALTSGAVSVLGGTAWLWSREDAAGIVDVLFVDEAGQMSLANALAVSLAARSLVLLGDPQQLEQPQKGTHPDGVDVSALEHVLGGHQTMPSDRGLFLPITWRLAPAICRFTSELFYEGKLESKPGLENQQLTGTGIVDGAGLWVMPVAHRGNQSWSAEEVEVVCALVSRLLSPGASWIDEHGIVRQLTPRDIRIVAPFNAQVNRIEERLAARKSRATDDAVPVGTVDKFQGQEAPVVIYSMTSSSPEDAPRGMGFLYNLNRLNVATSRARCAAILVASPRLFEPECKTPRQMQLANGLCRFRELATEVRL